MSHEALLRWAESDADLQGALAVRTRVFCDEQGVPLEEEIDGRDEEAMHLVALTPAGEIIATLRLLFAGGVVKIGRVAVDRSWRGRAIASRMLSMALTEAAARGAGEARLASQLEVIDLYRQAGFEVCSDVFEEAGIEHVWMERAL